MDLEYHPAAAEEYLAALRRYLEYDEATAGRFAEDVGHAEEQVVGAPGRWPIHLHGTRRVLLRRFPSSLIYLEGEDRTLIVALAHQHRRPGYWKRRAR